MDSLLQVNYILMTKKNNALLAPDADVWRFIRENHPSIELYYSDESHPAESGSYAAACCFYTVFFRKDPTLISFDYTLGKQEATIIKKAVRQLVYDKLVDQ